MPHAVRISARALREIDEALDWLAENSRTAPARWYAQLMKAVRSLEANPERCALAPENDWYPGKLRQLLYGRRRGVYRILFEIRDQIVYILRVRHCAQELLDPGSQ